MSTLKTAAIVIGAAVVVGTAAYIIKERAQKKRVEAFTNSVEELTNTIIRSAGFTDKKLNRSLIDLCT
jgi:hypothetical protein